MKKFWLFFVSILMFISVIGCAGITSQPAEQIALQIVAQRVGYAVGHNNPSIVPQAKLIAQGITASGNADLTKVALNTAISALSKQFPNDPLLASDIALIVSGLNLQLPATKIDLGQLSPLINAFVSGLDIGAGSK
jgi:hypothetical protein